MTVSNTATPILKSHFFIQEHDSKQVRTTPRERVGYYQNAVCGMRNAELHRPRLEFLIPHSALRVTPETIRLRRWFRH